MKQMRTQRNEGIALVTATIFVAVALLVLVALGTRVVTQVNHVNITEAQRECFYGVESGVAAAWASVENTGNGNVGLGAWILPIGTPVSAAVLPTFETDGVAPLTLQGMGNVQYMGYAHNWMNETASTTMAMARLTAWTNWAITRSTAWLEKRTASTGLRRS